MRTFAKLLPLALVAPILALPLLLAGPAAADALPVPGTPWPRCHTGSDTDGQYCILSVTRDGQEMDLAPGTVDGDYEVPFVDFLGPGPGPAGNDVRLGIERWNRVGMPAPDLGNISPDHQWVFVLNTGAARVTELTGAMREVSQSSGGTSTGGWTTTVTFHPVPIAWLSDYEACTFENGCGDEHTVADQVYDGFMTGRLSDGTTEGRPDWAVAARAGLVEVGNAQGVSTEYDFDTNALVVRLVNPHLRSTGPDVAAEGWFETFLPDAWLTRNYHVPDPTTLTTASAFSVRRVGTSTPVDYTVTRQAGGVWVRISDFGFSTPEFRVRPKPTAPGVPRWGSVARAGTHAVRVRFRAPLADGGAAITRYTARCHRGTAAWKQVSGAGSPLTVRGVPAKPVTCQVRAVNRIGPGAWSRARAE
ncbi:MAG TPA: fibronectin type III domain-containing protein [Nocardioides sp.]|uniref:fibronectin type III domain-containing protein n=1 Tax=Nocardioides sp. TaxID=35761 RepID=UPI002C972795|nr:fibronectin type III domain-containing protein [Nocardioides sp.]HQR27610.1 fibronectin type III domain-containing protein [Nocardioides sp.]